MEFKKKKGFTLVEMVLVVTILGVLSSIAFMKFGGVQERAQKNADYIAASNIATAINLGINDRVIDEENNKDILEVLKSNGYITSIPKPQSITGEFDIKVDSKGEITIKVGDTTFYPR
ncbi:type II secretion system protein [Clostridium sp. CCUG 7971]|uniref:type II secretion system protein n=1 Tax=Clostridium sp. CCUG 7971 TaxID=2811414 RepID=UPI001ABA1FC7|nr:type II secretion system protein [Clostridium sp. CCUG 7971]MBO3444685.1 type II secretion system protein [Clostridium sp. CCUG 7971]